MGDPYEANMANGEDTGDSLDGQEADVEELAQEYCALDTTLDQVASCLDTLEQQNDSLYSKLQALLSDSIATREELSQANADHRLAEDAAKLSIETNSASTNIPDFSQTSNSQTTYVNEQSKENVEKAGNTDEAENGENKDASFVSAQFKDSLTEQDKSS